MFFIVLGDIAMGKHFRDTLNFIIIVQYTK